MCQSDRGFLLNDETLGYKYKQKKKKKKNFSKNNTKTNDKFIDI